MSRSAPLLLQSESAMDARDYSIKAISSLLLYIRRYRRQRKSLPLAMCICMRVWMRTSTSNNNNTKKREEKKIGNAQRSVHILVSNFTQMKFVAFRQWLQNRWHFDSKYTRCCLLREPNLPVSPNDRYCTRDAFDGFVKCFFFFWLLLLLCVFEMWRRLGRHNRIDFLYLYYLNTTVLYALALAHIWIRWTFLLVSPEK